MNASDPVEREVAARAVAVALDGEVVSVGRCDEGGCRRGRVEDGEVQRRRRRLRGTGRDRHRLRDPVPVEGQVAAGDDCRPRSRRSCRREDRGRRRLGLAVVVDRVQMGGALGDGAAVGPGVLVERRDPDVRCAAEEADQLAAGQAVPVGA